MFQRTIAINKLLKLTKRKKVVQGGTWGGKTFGIIAVNINYLIVNEGKHLTVVAESIPAIKRGALKDFMDIMIALGRWDQSCYNATDRIYRYPNGSIIEFNSFDSVGKAQAAGKRTDLFINEAPYIKYDIADALIMRTSGNIWIDFNPTHEFWAHTEILPNNDAEFLLLKHSDNEALPQTIKDELLMKVEKGKTSEYWANWCRVYIDGEIGSLQGVVFSNWKQIDSVPKEAKLIRHGLDFGFSNDPMGCLTIFEYNGDLVVRQNIYQTHMGISELVARLKQLEPGEIKCDSSQPMLIDELRKAGVNAVACIKGKDSIDFGIEKLNERNILVTSDSTDLIKELRSYVYNKETNRPIDAFNHLIDALRYAYVIATPVTIVGKNYQRNHN